MRAIEFSGTFAGKKSDSLCHAEIAFRVIGRHAAFIAKSEMKPFPRQLARDAGKLGVNGPRRISAGEGDAKRIAFGQRGAGLRQNELRRVAARNFWRG